MRILIASDSFKDALASREVCLALERGIRRALPGAEVVVCPLADGGEGTLDVLTDQLSLKAVFVETCDPLRRPVTKPFYLSDDGQTAFVEMAKTAGLQQLKPLERNPLYTSTYGTGLHVREALRRNAQKLVLAIGGSATNDAGMGLAAALGYKFLNTEGKMLEPVGDNLINVHAVERPKKPFDIDTLVICDVTNPLYGPEGAAHVYARQKGADTKAVDHLDRGLEHFASVMARSGFTADPNLPGAGAAGGMGYGAMAFLNARLERGIEVVLRLTGFDERLQKTDLLVTGEGSIDAQTAHGKLVQGLCARARVYKVPVVAFCGVLSTSETMLQTIGLAAAKSINDAKPDVPLEEKLQNTAQNLEETAENWFKTHDLNHL